MNRKSFLGGLSALVGLGSFNLPAGEEENEGTLVIPHKLKPGDRVGITSPAGYILLEEIRPAMEQLRAWGLEPVVGASIGKRDFTFGGTDEERVSDMQQMLDDPTLKAVLCARGGYGMVRIIDKLHFEKFRIHPKWVIGFSDITVMHSHINRNLGIASIHSKMCNSFPEDWIKAEPIQVETILSIREALMGTKMSYSAVWNEKNRFGKAEGSLVGGNLKTLESLAGSASDLRTAGKILFVEDTGEYLYSIDRMFWNLKRSGKLDKLAGLIIGGFKIKVDDPGDDFGKTLQDIVLEKTRKYTYPICFDFPVGHQKNNFALKCGVRHQLLVGENGTTLKEV